jgi:uncharacterized protein YcaQ
MTTLTLPQARALALHAQGLFSAPQQAAQKEDVLQAIQKIGVLQIDTINIVARAPYFALWSRLGDYPLEWVDELLAEKQLFEYWAHAACFIPAEQYPYHRRTILEGKRYHHYATWYQNHQADSDQILEYVRSHGAVKSADFKRKDGKKGTWWDWKIEKDALEYWLAAGEMMVLRRDKFQRVYDLRERVRPDWSDADAPSMEDTLRYFVLTSIRALGIARPDWVADYYRLMKAETTQAIKELLQAGEIREIAVAGWEEPCLIPAELYQQVVNNEIDWQSHNTTLLCPFDALIWDRKRARQLFNYDFSIECYLPASRRKYGYYLLSVLHNGQIVARLDVKAHRKAGLFEVKGFFWEPGYIATDTDRGEIAAAIQRCADWHQTPQVQLPDSF